MHVPQQIIQILNQTLLPRIHSFDPIRTMEQLTPSFLQAPHGVVTILFSHIEGLSTLKSWNEIKAQQAIALHNELLRSMLQVHRGYENRQHEGSFLLVFQNAKSAVEWSIATQARNTAECMRLYRIVFDYGR